MSTEPCAKGEAGHEDEGRIKLSRADCLVSVGVEDVAGILCHFSELLVSTTWYAVV